MSDMDYWRNAETPEEVISGPSRIRPEPADDEVRIMREAKDLLIGLGALALSLVAITLLYRLFRSEAFWMY